jgi:hypothetical protein
LLRLILFLFLLYVLYLLLRGYHFGRTSQSSRRQQKGPSAAQEEELVLDPQCQSYIPKKDAISQAGKFFCSEECARLYLNR